MWPSWTPLWASISPQSRCPEKRGRVSSLKKFVDEEIVPRLDKVQEALTAFDGDEYPSDLEELIARSLEESYVDTNWDPREIDAPKEYGRANLSGIESIYDMNVYSIWRASDRELFAEAECGVDILFYLIIDEWRYDPIDDEFMTTYERQRRVGLPERTHKTVAMTASVEFTYDFRDKAITSLSAKLSHAGLI